MRELVAHDAKGVVAFGARGHHTRAGLWTAAARLARVLPAASEDRSVLLVFENDRFLFAAALLATWARGLTALIPPDNRRTTLTRLQSFPGVVAILHDTESGLRLRVQDVLRGPDSAPDLEQVQDSVLRRWQSSVPFLHVFGGVARGESKRTSLSGAVLQAELTRLQRVLPWSNEVRVASSVSVGHRYGLVWTVLRPLVSGGAFLRELGRSASPVGERLLELSDTLVSYPGELRLLSPREGPPLREAISSASPLHDTDMEIVERALGVRPIDILTTTPSGALAWRPDASSTWKVLPHVSLTPVAEGTRVEVSNPSELISVETTRDVLRPEADGARLLGRSDRSVGPPSEVNLDALEHALARIPGVLDAGVQLSGGPEPRLLAAVASRAPVKAKVWEALRSMAPLSDVDVRVAPALPRDGIGRLSAHRMLALFGRGPDGCPRAARLEWHAQSEDAQEPRFLVRVPEDYRWFDGHFESYPVLPAAVQMHELVVPSAQRAGLLRGPVQRFERLKFSQPIRPGMVVVVVLTPTKPGEIRFDLRFEGGVLSSGRLIHDEPER